MNKRIFQLVLVIVLIVLGWVAVSTLSKSISSTFEPLKQANDKLSTQVTDLLHPTPTIIPDPVTIIHDVRSLARLETIQYTVEKVITAETGQGDFAFLFADRLLLVAHGYVIAGVDLEKLGPDDLWLEAGVLKMQLPEPEIFVATLDNEKTYVFERDTSVLRTADQNLETLARQAAEKEIYNAAIEDGILEIARQNAEAYLTRLFLSMGYPDVMFEQTSP